MHPEIVLPIAVIVFGAALLIQGGTMLSEYASIVFPAGTAATAASGGLGVGGLSTLFLVGVAGIVLGILALVGVAAGSLTAISVIAFGTALLLSSSAARHLSTLQQTSGSSAPRSGAEMLAGELASGSAGVQMLAGLAAIVLGVLAVGMNQNILTLVALIVLGGTIILTGSALIGLVIGFVQSTSTPRRRPTMP